MKTNNTQRGFTILELVITVIIIAVLVMVALPMYKHAVLKSRFSTVMPMAKAVADAQEVYYLGNNQYALGKEDLDIAPVEAENTQVTLSSVEEEDEYIYVAANRTDIPNVRYIMYQKNSPKFAGNIHCEAKADNDDALWLCEKGLQGVEVSGSGSLQGKNYKTFLLAGNQGDSTFLTCPANATCDEEGTVTGCADGYYQEEQTCKQEIACDNTQEFIRTPCDENCGEEIKKGTCNVKTGQWENYTVTQACPEKLDTEEPCEEGSDSKKTRSVVCSNNQWVMQGDWDTSSCKKECDPDQEPKTSQTCDEYKGTSNQWCGTVTQEVECDYKTGEWKVSNVQSNCTTSDYSVGATQDCGSNYCGGNKTLRSASCNASNGTWSYDWNTSSCKTTDSESTFYTSCSSYGYTGSGWVYQTRTCSNGNWSGYSMDTSGCTGCTKWSKPNDRKGELIGYKLYTRDVTCSNGSWVTGDWVFQQSYSNAGEWCDAIGNDAGCEFPQCECVL